jgi:HlyD family secretion protein
MRLRKRPLRWPMVAVVVVVLAGGGTAYAVGRGPDGPHYRTVAATRGDVEETLSTTGQVDAARRSDLSFGTDGTVASVKVAVGDRVKAGDVIATLDTAQLDAAVTKANATLAQAIAQLASDRAAQSSSVQDASNQPAKPSTPNNGATTPTGGNGSASAALIKQLHAEQQAVIDAQTAASAALVAAKDALAAQTTACADAYGSAGPAPTATPTDDASSAASADTDAANAACDAALADVQAKQAAVKEAQDALAKALDTLAATLTKALGSVAGNGGKSPANNARAAASDGTTPIGSNNPSDSSGTTVTAARLASDQAQIDQARADLTSAKQERSLATLRSTRTGRVVVLDVAKGDAATAGTTVATVVGGKAVTLTATVAETSIDRVKVGQLVRVGVPGQSKTTDGRVTAIGMVADTSSGTTSYPVTVTVEDPAIALPTGSRASMAIVLSTARDVLTLPTSAISGTGSRASVRVWDGKTLTTKRVRIGAIGSRSVEIAGGITAGTEVVVADIDQAIKGASSELNQRGGFGNLPAVEFRSSGGGGGPQTFVNGGPGK